MRRRQANGVGDNEAKHAAAASPSSSPAASTHQQMQPFQWPNRPVLHLLPPATTPQIVLSATLTTPPAMQRGKHTNGERARALM